jgi:hypothetical protein
MKVRLAVNWEATMFPAEMKDGVIEGALAISTVLLLTRVIIADLAQVVDTCKECYHRISPAETELRKQPTRRKARR